MAAVHFYLGMSKAYVFSNRLGYGYYVDIIYDNDPFNWFEDEDEYDCFPVYGYTPGDSGDRYWVK